MKGLYRKYSHYDYKQHRNKFEGRTDSKLIRQAPVDDDTPFEAPRRKPGKKVRPWELWGRIPDPKDRFAEIHKDWYRMGRYPTREAAEQSAKARGRHRYYDKYEYKLIGPNGTTDNLTAVTNHQPNNVKGTK